MNLFAGILDRCVPELAGAWRGEMTIERIALRLAHIVRFQGEASGGYSVAQHSLLVAGRVGPHPEVRLAALLHDVPEALLLGDIVKPVKARVQFGGVPLEVAEEALLAEILRRHGLRPALPDVAVEADEVMAAIEARELTDLTFWKGMGLPRMTIHVLEPLQAATRFVAVYDDLVKEVRSCELAAAQ